MLKKLFTISALCLSLVGVGSAANVAFNNIDLAAGPAAAPVTLADMTTAVPNNTGFVAVGSFNMAPAAITLANIAAVKGDFIQFGTAVTFGGAGGFGIDGLFGGDASQPINAGDVLIGKNIYIVAGNAATFGASEQVLVYRFNEVFAADNPVFADTADLTGEKPAFSGLLIGSQDPSQDVPGIGTTDGLSLALIPEPTISLLGLVGAFLLIRRRRG